MEHLIFYQIDQFRVDDLSKKSGNPAVNDNENKQQGSNNAIVISTQKWDISWTFFCLCTDSEGDTRWNGNGQFCVLLGK